MTAAQVQTPLRAQVPEGHKGPTVFVAAELGFEARNLLRSSLTSALNERGAHVVALVPDPDDEHLSPELRAAGITVERLEVERAADHLQGSRVQRWLRIVRTYGMSRGDGAQFLDEKADSRYKRRTNPRVLAALKVVARPVRRFRWCKRVLIEVESRVFRPQLHSGLFDRYSPSLVITATPGFQPHDAYLLREARLRKVRSLVVFSSWDAPTSKGLAGCAPTAAVAWGERMADDLVRYQGIRRDRLVVGGVPYFDIYLRTPGEGARQYLNERYGLDPERRLVLFGTKSPFSYPNFAVVEVLARAIESGLAEPAQLLVRLHPLHFKPEFRSTPAARRLMERYESIRRRYPHVFLNVPDIPSSAVRLGFSNQEAREVAMLLRGSDVLVTPFSTLLVEAALCATPTVSVSFDPPSSAEVEEGMYRSIWVDRRQPHARLVGAAGGVRVAESQEQLIDAVNTYLRDPNLDAEGRTRFVTAECGFLDGRSGDRVAGFALELARRHT